MKRFLALITLCGSAACMLHASSAAAQTASVAVTDHLTVSQWINPATPGEVGGRVFLLLANGSAEAIADAVVVMANQDGERFLGVTDEMGRFNIAGIKPGVYALTARSAGVFACYAMHVVDGERPAADRLPQQVEIAAAAIDYTVVKAFFLRYLPPYRNDTFYTIDNVDLAGLSGRVGGENLFRVNQSDGGFKGRLYVAGARDSTLQDAGLMNVFLFHQGEARARVVSMQDGSFAFADVAPGTYSILALGQAGLGMAGFELIDDSIVNPVSATVNAGNAIAQDAITLTSLRDDRGFAMQVVPLLQAIEMFNDSVAQDEAFEAVDELGNAMSEGDLGGFSSGGGGGGGGGGGFGGGFLGLAGLAGLAGLNNNDDPIIVPPDPVSPVR